MNGNINPVGVGATPSNSTSTGNSGHPYRQPHHQGQFYSSITSANPLIMHGGHAMIHPPPIAAGRAMELTQHQQQHNLPSAPPPPPNNALLLAQSSVDATTTTTIRRALDQYQLLQQPVETSSAFTNATTSLSYQGKDPPQTLTSTSGMTRPLEPPYNQQSYATAEAQGEYSYPAVASTEQPPVVRRSRRNDLDRERRKSETDEEREARLEKRRLAQYKKLSEVPEDEIQQKRERRNAVERQRRQNETHEERLERLAKRKEYEQRRKSQFGGDHPRKNKRSKTSTSSNSSTASPKQQRRRKLSSATTGSDPIQEQQREATEQPTLLPPHHMLPWQQDVPLVSYSSQIQVPAPVASQELNSLYPLPSKQPAHHPPQTERSTYRGKVETDDERALRRAKRNEYDRRRYQARKGVTPTTTTAQETTAATTTVSSLSLVAAEDWVPPPPPPPVNECETSYVGQQQQHVEAERLAPAAASGLDDEDIVQIVSV